MGAGHADPNRLHFSLAQRWVASVQGVTVPLALFLELLIGIWLMARPDIIAGTRLSANFDHLLGAVAVTVAAIAVAEVTRVARYFNILVGLVLIAIGLALPNNAPAMASECASGALLILLSIPRGIIVESYGGWDKFVK